MSTLNLNKYEAMILNELLKENPLQVKQIFERSGLPRSRVYDVAIDLGKKGYLKIEQPKKIKVEGETRWGKTKIVEKTVPTTFTLLTQEEIIKRMRNKLKSELKLRIGALLIIFKNEEKKWNSK